MISFLEEAIDERAFLTEVLETNVVFMSVWAQMFLFQCLPPVRPPQVINAANMVD